MKVKLFYPGTRFVQLDINGTIYRIYSKSTLTIDIPELTDEIKDHIKSKNVKYTTGQDFAKTSIEDVAKAMKDAEATVSENETVQDMDVEVKEVNEEIKEHSIGPDNIPDINNADSEVESQGTENDTSEVEPQGTQKAEDEVINMVDATPKNAEKVQVEPVKPEAPKEAKSAEEKLAAKVAIEENPITPNAKPTAPARKRRPRKK